MAKIISPQMQVKQFVESMYPGRNIEVKGERPPARGGKKRPYTAYLLVDGKVMITAQEKSWRTAYKTLQINISKGSIL